MMKKFLKVLWILFSVVVLCVTLFSYDKELGNDSGIFLVYGMLFLSFPSSIIIAGLITLLVLLQENLGIPILDLIGNTYVGFLVMWLLFFLCGYYQWFKFVPWVWRKWMKKNVKMRTR